MCSSNTTRTAPLMLEHLGKGNQCWHWWANKGLNDAHRRQHIHSWWMINYPAVRHKRGTNSVQGNETLLPKLTIHMSTVKKCLYRIQIISWPLTIRAKLYKQQGDKGEGKRLTMAPSCKKRHPVDGNRNSAMLIVEMVDMVCGTETRRHTCCPSLDGE